MFMESKGKTRLIRISVWVAVLSLLFTVLSSLATALGASAHAALKSVTPGDGTTVAQAPAQVVLTFNEAISTSFAAVTVTDGQGAPVTRGRPAVAGPTVTQALEPVGSGTYTVSFRVVSEDGHAVSSRTTFRVRLAAGTTPASGTVATPTSSASETSPADTSSPSTTQVSAPSAAGPATALPWGLAAVAAIAAVAAAVALGRGWSRRE